MVSKDFGTHQWVLFGCLLCCAVLLFTAPRRLTCRMQLAFVSRLDAPRRVCRAWQSRLFADKPSGDGVSRSEYLRLRNHLANNLRMLDSERQKIAELSGLANRFVWKGAKFVSASVITSYLDALRGQLVIDRGQSDGLRAGQFVLGDDSIIGVISELGSRTARVILTTDPSAETAVEFGNVDYRGVMRGLGDNGATIPLLPAKYKIQEADIVYACKKPGFLDNAVITGIVSRCRRDDNDPLLWDIIIEPACEVDKLEKVVVVITDPQEQEE